MRLPPAPLLTVLLLAVTGLAHADDDIVWPTYDRASYAADAALSCPQLRAAVAHVQSDIALLGKARDRVTAIVRNGFANEDSVGRLGDRRFDHTSYRSGQEGYIKARDEIITSRKIAFLRLDVLNALLPGCQEPAPTGHPTP